MTKKNQLIVGKKAAAKAGSTGSRTGPTNAANARIPFSLTSLTLLDSNTERMGATFYNDSDGPLYLLAGSGTASLTNYTWILATNTGYDIPNGTQGIPTMRYNGVWIGATTGGCQVTEYHP